MWVPKGLVELFSIGKEVVAELRTENSILKSKNELLERELVSAKIIGDWCRLRVNQLEVERVHLIEKAYPGLQLPAPELSRVNKIKDSLGLQSLFDDLGDELVS